MEGGGGGGGSTGGRAPMAEAHLYHRERRRDLMPLKLAVFDAMAAAAASSSPSASRNNGGSSRPPRQRPPICKLWALYRKSLRLFLIGELSKPELDAVVIYTLGEENVHLHNDLIRGLVQNVLGTAGAAAAPCPAATATQLSAAGTEEMLQDEREGQAGPSPSASEARRRKSRKRKRETAAAVPAMVPYSDSETDSSNISSENDSVSAASDDSDVEDEQSKRLQEVFTRELGPQSAVWDVWAPMRESSKRRRLQEQQALEAEQEYRKVKALMDYAYMNSTTNHKNSLLVPSGAAAAFSGVTSASSSSSSSSNSDSSSGSNNGDSPLSSSGTSTTQGRTAMMECEEEKITVVGAATTAAAAIATDTCPAGTDNGKDIQQEPQPRPLEETEKQQLQGEHRQSESSNGTSSITGDGGNKVKEVEGVVKTTAEPRNGGDNEKQQAVPGQQQQQQQQQEQWVETSASSASAGDTTKALLPKESSNASIDKDQKEAPTSCSVAADNNNGDFAFLPPACMPNTFLVHYILRTAGRGIKRPVSSLLQTADDGTVRQQQKRQHIGANNSINEGRGYGALPPLPSLQPSQQPVPSLSCSRERKLSLQQQQQQLVQEEYEAQNLAVSREAVLAMTEGAEEFVNRVLRRCIHVVTAAGKQGVEFTGEGEEARDAKAEEENDGERTAPGEGGETDGEGRKHPSSAAKSMNMNGSSIENPAASVVAAADHDKGQPSPTAACPLGSEREGDEKEKASVCDEAAALAAAEKREKQTVIDASALFRALRVPNMKDQRDPIGRLFPSDELLEDLVASTIS